MTSALYATNAIMFALYNRDVRGGSGQVVDVSLFESLFSLLGPLPAEYAALGRQRERNGRKSKNAGPRGCFATSGGRWIAVSGSTPKMAERFLRAYGLGHLLDEPRFATNEARVEHADELDRAVTGAIASKTIADIENDPHWRARRLTLSVPNGATPVRMRNVVPRLSDTPGEIAWAGGTLGAHNAEIYNAELGLSGEDVERLTRAGVI